MNVHCRSLDVLFLPPSSYPLLSVCLGMGASVFFFVGWGRDTVLSTEAVLTEGKSESIDIRPEGDLDLSNKRRGERRKKVDNNKSSGFVWLEWGSGYFAVTKRNVLRPL